MSIKQERVNTQIEKKFIRHNSRCIIGGKCLAYAVCSKKKLLRLNKFTTPSLLLQQFYIPLLQDYLLMSVPSPTPVKLDSLKGQWETGQSEPPVLGLDAVQLEGHSRSQECTSLPHSIPRPRYTELHSRSRANGATALNRHRAAADMEELGLQYMVRAAQRPGKRCAMGRKPVESVPYVPLDSAKLRKATREAGIVRRTRTPVLESIIYSNAEDYESLDKHKGRFRRDRSRQTDERCQLDLKITAATEEVNVIDKCKLLVNNNSQIPNRGQKSKVCAFLG